MERKRRIQATASAKVTTNPTNPGPRLWSMGLMPTS
jgi:hypothetical protein